MSEETQPASEPETTTPAAEEATAGGEAAESAEAPPAKEADAEASPEKVLPDAEDRRALIEAVIFVAEEPLPLKQIATGLDFPADTVKEDLDALVATYAGPTHGIEIRNVAGGYRMYTKAERHEEVKAFVKTLRPKLKLSMPALETLAVVAYKQPVTVPEIQAIRGVNVSGVINTLLQRKLIAPAGRKKVIGKPMMYKTTKEFLVQFGLSGVDELPSLKELEELSKAAFGEAEEPEIETAETAAQVDSEEPSVEQEDKTPNAPDAGSESAEEEEPDDAEAADDERPPPAND